MDPRVRIAKDVIARLDSKTFKAKTGHFLRSPILKGLTNDSDARKALRGKSCTGCARGALFLARLDKQNSLTIADLQTFEFKSEDMYGVGCVSDGCRVGVERDETSAYLEEFTEDELKRIETAFEKNEGFGLYDGTGSAAAEFGRRYKSDAKRLRAICANIIKNKGEFRPQDEV